VIDARFVVRGRVDGVLAEAQLLGLIVGPRTGAAFLGYERDAVNKPALLNALFARRQKGSFLVDWDDVADIGDVVELRDGYTRWSSHLR
jgi:hypothetical protein